MGVAHSAHSCMSVRSELTVAHIQERHTSLPPPKRTSLGGGAIGSDSPTFYVAAAPESTTGGWPCADLARADEEVLREAPSITVFCSYFQSTAGGAALALREGLHAAASATGARLQLWLDLDADPTADGMAAGVTSADVVLLFMSPGFLTRPAVQHEVATGLAAGKRFVVVAVGGATASGVLSEGRAFSAARPLAAPDNALARLSASDFDALALLLKEPAATFYADPAMFARHTLPDIAAALRLPEMPPTSTPHARPAHIPAAPCRMRRPPPLQAPSGMPSSDVLIVAAQPTDAGCGGSALALYLALALRSAVSRRALSISILNVSRESCNISAAASAAVGCAAVVVFVLTARWWLDPAVAAAVTAALARKKTGQHQSQGTPFSTEAVWEADARFDGVYPIGALIDSTPAELRALYMHVTARRFQRELPHRAADLLRLARACGAVDASSQAGPFPPPTLPRAFNPIPVLASHDALLEALTSGDAVAVAFGGSGGAGKSTLAAAVAADARLRAAFDDIYWIPVGQGSPAELAARLAVLIAELESCEGSLPLTVAPGVSTLDQCARELRVRLRGRRALLIADDVCSAASAVAFLRAVGAHTPAAAPAEGPRLLLTTRSVEVFQHAAAAVVGARWPAGSTRHGGCLCTVAVELTHAAASAMLAAAACLTPAAAGSIDLTPALTANGVRLPLPLTVVGAAIAASLAPLAAGSITASSAAAFAALPARLSLGPSTSSNRGAAAGRLSDPTFVAALTSLSPDFSAYLPSYRAVDFALAAQFSADDASQFCTLGVFPKDAAVPVEMLCAAWRLPPHRAIELMGRFASAGLVKLEAVSAGGRSASEATSAPLVALHDLPRDYALAACTGAWHAELLDRVAAAGGVGRSWWAIPRGPLCSYVLSHALFHLNKAGRFDEVTCLLMSHAWLAAVLALRGYGALLEDVRVHGWHAAEAVGGHMAAAPFRLLHQALRLAAPRLLGVGTPELVRASSLGRDGRDSPQAAAAAARVLAQELTGRISADLAGQHPGTLGALLASAWDAIEAGGWLGFTSASLGRPGGACGSVLVGHAEHVSCVTALPCGTVASASRDNTVRLWDPTTGACERLLEGHTSYVTCLATLPHNRLVSGSNDHTLRVWDAETGACEATLEGYSERLRCVAVLPRGIIISGSRDGTLRCWSLETCSCERILEGHEGDVVCVAVWQCEGRDCVVSGGKDGTVRVWKVDDAATGGGVSNGGARVLQGHTADVWCITHLPGDRLVATGSRDTTVRLWDPMSGVCERVLEGHSRDVYCLAVLLPPAAAGGGGGFLVSGGWDGTVRVWDWQVGTCSRVLIGHTKDVFCIAALPDGRVVSGSNDKSARVWQVEDGACTVLEGHTHFVSCVTVTSSGEIATGSNDCTVRLWNPQSPQAGTAAVDGAMGGHTEAVTCLAALPRGRVLSGSSDSTLRTWSVTTGICEGVLRGHASGVTSCVALSSGRAASGSRDRSIRIWNVETSICERVLEGHTSSIVSLALLLRGGYSSPKLVSGSWDKTARVWDVEAGVCERVVAQSETDFSAINPVALRSAEMMAEPVKRNGPVVVDGVTGATLCFVDENLTEVVAWRGDACMQVAASSGRTLHFMISRR